MASGQQTDFFGWRVVGAAFVLAVFGIIRGLEAGMGGAVFVAAIAVKLLACLAFFAGRRAH